MTDVTRGVSALGGGYADSDADAGPTVKAVLGAAHPGSSAARLVVLAGPPGVGKSAVARRLLDISPNWFVVDKDVGAAGFILAAGRTAGHSPDLAYGTQQYWRELRPLEYGGAVSHACDNLVGTRTVLLVGGWGPELAVSELWTELSIRLAPARLRVLHLDAPQRDTWRLRLSQRGSRTDEPWFSRFADAVTSFEVWSGAFRLSTEPPMHVVVQSAWQSLEENR